MRKSRTENDQCLPVSRSKYDFPGIARKEIA
jgi:hypothetical protein